jgi:starch phosphorylase
MMPNTKARFQEAVRRHLTYSTAKPLERASRYDWFQAVSLAVREFMIDGMLATEERCRKSDAKRLYYLSIEFLMGRTLGNTLHNLNLYDLCKEALVEMGADLEEVQEIETDAALGNGGLGRLAACFLDSLASQDFPGYGYGINYEFGLFKQQIINGHQREKPDYWSGVSSPWLIERPERACLVPLYGRVEHAVDKRGRYNPMWLDWQLLVGVPYDMPVVGYGGRTVNYLRLFSARTSEEFDIQIFNDGDYFRAVEQKIQSESVSKLLYPSDSVTAGKELRLIQEYFLVACTLRDIMQRYLGVHQNLAGFAQKVAIQLNDTHPALAVAELMRLLIDERSLEWESAWRITRSTLGYTNHTLMPEALETWPVSLVERVLPRHLQIIYEINRRFLEEVSVRWPGNTEYLRRMSIIAESDPPQVRMAHLAIVGSHSVNGVAALHSELVKTELVPDFYEMWPQKFNNKTNGITPRRWLLKANPPLAALITKTIGDGWITRLERLQGLEAYAADPEFQQEFSDVKTANKKILADLIQKTCGITVDVNTLFDVQIKRIHEYKRQLLSVMHIIHQYLSIIEDGRAPVVPRTYIFAGKAAPGYAAAKLIIKLINSVAGVVNHDKRVRDRIKVAFIPDYRVSLAEKIIPAADLSEQISTAGMEASGTGNMKLSLNGALTIGTMDGANVEIREEVGPENIYIFGLNVDDIRQMRSAYDPRGYYDRNDDIKRVVDAIDSDMFCSGEAGLFAPIRQNLLDNGDYYFHLADFAAYLNSQQRVSEDYLEPAGWVRKSILNVARMGKFSSDRTINEYARDIWHITRAADAARSQPGRRNPGGSSVIRR